MFMTNSISVALIIQLICRKSTVSAQVTRNYFAPGAVRDWYNANQLCVEIVNGSLATINTDDDYIALRDAKDNASPRRNQIADDVPFWVGLYQQPSGEFVWSDGTPCECIGGLCVTDWLETPEFNINDTDYCAILTVNSTTKARGYRAVPCASDYDFLCSYINETSSNLPTPNSTVAETICYIDPPTTNPTTEPTINPSTDPTLDPTVDPTVDPTTDPTIDPTADPTADPTIDPTTNPLSDTVETTIDSLDTTTTIVILASLHPTAQPTIQPTSNPAIEATTNPLIYTTSDSTIETTATIAAIDTLDGTADPTLEPTSNPLTNPSETQLMSKTTTAMSTEETEETFGTEDVCNDGKLRFSSYEEIGDKRVEYCYDGLDDDGHPQYIALLVGGDAIMYYSDDIEEVEGASGFVIYYEDQVVAHCVGETNPIKCSRKWMILNVNDIFVEDDNMKTFNCECGEVIDGTTPLSVILTAIVCCIFGILF